MNRQPFRTPPKSWQPLMTPWLARFMRPIIRRDLKHQQIRHLEIRGADGLRRVLREGAGVLVTPNHSFHYDSYVLMEASHRIGRPFHIMTAWQVFQMSTPFERWLMQRHGCFSVDRESGDVGALKRAIEILTDSPHPLVVFPEGDIYHHCDRVSPFHDGAAGIALSAAKRAKRKVMAVPCSLKCFYVSDPTPTLKDILDRLELSLHWRPQSQLTLEERVYRLAQGILTLKEVEYLGHAQMGNLVARIGRLADHVLTRLERKHGNSRNDPTIPERVKTLRREVIRQLERDGLDDDTRQSLTIDMEDLFFVVQLYSYPGDYVAERPVIERIAETLDKFEEDLLQADYPGVRGPRRAVVQFGTPIEIPAERSVRGSVADWTSLLERQVQAGLDAINACESGSNAAAH